MTELKEEERDIQLAARDAYVDGVTISDISRELKISIDKLRHWKNHLNWDDIKRRVDQQVKEDRGKELIQRRSEIDDIYYKLWGAFDRQVYLYLRGAQEKKRIISPKTLDVLSKVLERSQKGRRTAVGADINVNVNEEHHVTIEYKGLDDRFGLREAMTSGPNGDGTIDFENVVDVEATNAAQEKYDDETPGVLE